MKKESGFGKSLVVVVTKRREIKTERGYRYERRTKGRECVVAWRDEVGRTIS